ncbi:MAG: flavin reductase domain protein FMN-binding protein [Firmicutes bacterium]|nr:flavin reductase domain protein FMN-binding protein [Bacillota bacterium]
MTKDISYQEYASTVLETISKGAFLTTSSGGRSNTMTIGWGSIGVMWGLPVFTVMVRQSRFTYELIENSNAFTVSIPLHDMQTELALCGSKSGRDMDKFSAAKLQPQPGKKVAVPVIGGCGLHYECEILYKNLMDPAQLDASVQQNFYKAGDYHTYYYGKIVACYLDT